MWSRFELDLDKRPLSHLLLFKQTLSQYVRTIPGDMNISSKTAAKLWRMLNKDQQTYFKKLTKKLIEAEIYRKSAYFIDIKRHNPLFWVFYYGGKRNRQPLEDKDLFHQESLQVPQYLKSSRKNDYNNLEDFNNANENQRNKVDELIQYGARIRDKDDTQSLSSENFNNHLRNNIKTYNYDDFTDLNQIGEGKFGDVYKAEWKNCKLTVALKQLKFMNGHDKNIFFKKIKQLKQVGFHPNITRIYGAIEDPVYGYCMAMQFANNGNLQEYLEHNVSKLQWIDKLSIAKDIACGLKFLHKSKIIHGNIHSKNILIHDGRAMIADFGYYSYDTSSKLDLNQYKMAAFIDPRALKNNLYKPD
ncbi:kinase-like domain-containing protein [Gigaspora rosea]|uniref:Kinase-like domain-containing protein n=1 Tax=Gigaspora rosea TaxID=44941 RepID=A0A397U8R8_9GLOM|nr:kinase-like domain-containing protein [Gigaspora rosea]